MVSPHQWNCCSTSPQILSLCLKGGHDGSWDYQCPYPVQDLCANQERVPFLQANEEWNWSWVSPALIPLAGCLCACIASSRLPVLSAWGTSRRSVVGMWTTRGGAWPCETPPAVSCCGSHGSSPVHVNDSHAKSMEKWVPLYSQTFSRLHSRANLHPRYSVDFKGYSSFGDQCICFAIYIIWDPELLVSFLLDSTNGGIGKRSKYSGRGNLSLNLCLLVISLLWSMLGIFKCRDLLLLFSPENKVQIFCPNLLYFRVTFMHTPKYSWDYQFWLSPLGFCLEITSFKSFSWPSKTMLDTC